MQMSQDHKNAGFVQRGWEAGDFLRIVPAKPFSLVERLSRVFIVT